MPGFAVPWRPAVRGRSTCVGSLRCARHERMLVGAGPHSGVLFASSPFDWHRRRDVAASDCMRGATVRRLAQQRRAARRAAVSCGRQLRLLRGSTDRAMRHRVNRADSGRYVPLRSVAAFVVR
jgi:hypothetical protein